jgi:thioredoxin
MLQISGEDLANKLSSDKHFLVLFSAPWCAPCKVLTPMLEEAAKADNIPLFKIDIDSEPAVARKYHVRSIPTTITFKNGEFHTVLQGLQPMNKIRKFLQD